MAFKVGDRVVYPHHGAAVIEKKETREVFGEKTEYFVLRWPTATSRWRCPPTRPKRSGCARRSAAEDVDDLFQLLAKKDVREPTNWSRRFKNHQEKLKSGDVYQVAEVVRNLALREVDEGPVGRREGDARTRPAACSFPSSASRSTSPRTRRSSG